MRLGRGSGRKQARTIRAGDTGELVFQDAADIRDIFEEKRIAEWDAARQLKHAQALKAGEDLGL
jgi:hypothetical protein